jgi:hypothetical protein
MKKSKKRSQNTVFGVKNDISKTYSNPQKSNKKVNHKKVPFLLHPKKVEIKKSEGEKLCSNGRHGLLV